jgi:hypothetical protein
MWVISINLGVTEITNVIIAVDKNGDSASLRRTFAAQEAPLVPIDQLPNQMNHPIEMGLYQLACNIDHGPQKAAGHAKMLKTLRFAITSPSCSGHN